MNKNIRNKISWDTIHKMFYDNNDFLIKHHINSYNMFFEKGIKEIFKDNNPLRIFKEQDNETKLYKYTCNMYFGEKMQIKFIMVNQLYMTNIKTIHPGTLYVSK